MESMVASQLESLHLKREGELNTSTLGERSYGTVLIGRLIEVYYGLWHVIGYTKFMVKMKHVPISLTK